MTDQTKPGPITFNDPNHPSSVLMLTCRLMGYVNIKWWREATEQDMRAAGFVRAPEASAQPSDTGPCAGAWVSGSGGHRVFAGGCETPPSWADLDDGRAFCDAHLPVTAQPSETDTRTEADLASALSALNKEARLAILEQMPQWSQLKYAVAEAQRETAQVKARATTAETAPEASAQSSETDPQWACVKCGGPTCREHAINYTAIYDRAFAAETALKASDAELDRTRSVLADERQRIREYKSSEADWRESNRDLEARLKVANREILLRERHIATPCPGCYWCKPADGGEKEEPGDFGSDPEDSAVLLALRQAIDKWLPFATDGARERDAKPAADVTGVLHARHRMGPGREAPRKAPKNG